MTSTDLVHIPGYTVLRLLGKGGTAAVYLATREDSEQEVAIKVLHPDSDTDTRLRCISEARILSTIDHPRVIKVYEVGQLEDGRDYIVMEYLSGGDLARLKGQNLGPMYALELVRQIAEGLSVVHRQGIIHRDIKPANILFRADGSAVLTDFGIAHDSREENPTPSADLATGSPTYASPEQFRGEALDQRADIYSLGVVLLELLLGHNPFKAEDYRQTLRNHARMPLPELPPPVRQYQPLLQRMLAKEPAERFASTDDLLTVIVDHAHGHSSLLDQSITRQFFTPAELDAETSPPHWKMVLALILVLVLAGAGGTLFYFNYPSPSDKKVSDLLALGQQRLQDGKLVDPEYDNARYYFSEVLKIEPTNNNALLGQEEVRKLQVARFLKLGDERLQQLHLTRPSNDSAFFYYQRALLLDPENKDAKAGLAQISAQYVALAQKAFASRDYNNGLSYVNSGLDVDPDNPVLQRLREQHKEQDGALARIYRKIFN